MTPDENAAVIDPRKGKREASLPPKGILVFTPQDLDLFMRCFPHAPQRSHRIFLADVYTGSFEATPVALAGPILGAPQAVMILEKLIALGVRQVIAVGWCGSLQEDLHAGDVVLPDSALSEEGTSQHYPIPMGNPGPSPELLQSLQHSLQETLTKGTVGRVWSTDAPYRETKCKVRSYQQQGVLAVDMETSALFTLARFRNIQLAVALMVSDSLSSLKWIHGFKDPEFLRTREALPGLTLKLLCSGLHSQEDQRE